MRYVLLAVFCLCAFAPTGEVSASSKYMKVGNFTIDRIDDHGNFLLDDGNTYKPISHNHKEETLDWQLGDPMLVMSGPHKNLFVVVNRRTGELTKMKITQLCD